MNSENLKKALETGLPTELTNDLVEDFLLIRQDVAAGLLGRSPPGKFVETVVQCLQFFEEDKYEKRPAVDPYLRKLESRQSPLDDDLKFCVSRVARAMYTIRSKRSILHKGQVDPNPYDLRFLLHGAQWVLSEILRQVIRTDMAEAGSLIEYVQAPVSSLVEDFGDYRIVLADLSIPDELLVLLHSQYPDALSRESIYRSLIRRKKKTVGTNLRRLWSGKLIEGNSEEGYKLTQTGVNKALSIIKQRI